MVAGSGCATAASTHSRTWPTSLEGGRKRRSATVRREPRRRRPNCVRVFPPREPRFTPTRPFAGSEESTETLPWPRRGIRSGVEGRQLDYAVAMQRPIAGEVAEVVGALGNAPQPESGPRTGSCRRPSARSRSPSTAPRSARRHRRTRPRGRTSAASRSRRSAESSGVLRASKLQGLWARTGCEMQARSQRRLASPRRETGASRGCRGGIRAGRSHLGALQSRPHRHPTEKIRFRHPVSSTEPAVSLCVAKGSIALHGKRNCPPIGR